MLHACVGNIPLLPALCCTHAVSTLCKTALLFQALTSSLGWKYLDVRSSLELEEVGRIKDSINVPMVNATKKWDSEQQKKVVKKEDNPDFVKQVTPHVYPSQVLTQTHMGPTELIYHCKCACDDLNLENVSWLHCIGVAVWNTCSLHLISVFGVCHAVEGSWHAGI